MKHIVLNIMIMIMFLKFASKACEFLRFDNTIGFYINAAVLKDNNSRVETFNNLHEK